MALKNIQRIFGFLNSQKIENNNIIVDEKYLKSLISFPNNPSDLNQLVLHIYKIAVSDDGILLENRSIPPEIEDKISYNNVIAYKEMINTFYSENGYYIDSAYESLDYETPGRKKYFLKYINQVYLSTLGEYQARNVSLNKIDVIKANADNIITDVINKLLLKIANNNSAIEHISGESIEYYVMVIVTHAFVDCKVLENPNNL